MDRYSNEILFELKEFFGIIRFMRDAEIYNQFPAIDYWDAYTNGIIAGRRPAYNRILVPAKEMMDNPAKAILYLKDDNVFTDILAHYVLEHYQV